LEHRPLLEDHHSEQDLVDRLLQVQQTRSGAEVVVQRQHPAKLNLCLELLLPHPLVKAKITKTRGKSEEGNIV